MMHLDHLRQAFASNEWPQFLAMQADTNRCQLRLYLSRQIHWFDGHFPEQPVLAGVVQTHWAGTIGKLMFAQAKVFLRIDNLKFKSILLPEQEVDLLLEFSEAACAIKFRYEYEHAVFSEGKLIFAQQSDTSTSRGR